jgi:hypothetical protein
MANAKSNNVIYVDTTGYTFDQTVTICYVKYIGNTSGTAVITVGTSGSGNKIWEEAGATNLSSDEIEARVDGFHVALTNGAKVYIYLEN